MGWIRPCALRLGASSSSLASSNTRRGFVGDSWSRDSGSIWNADLGSVLIGLSFRLFGIGGCFFLDFFRGSFPPQKVPLADWLYKPKGGKRSEGQPGSVN